ncbi:DUF2628 domain-containing protein [Agrobacterium sp. SORGH_AS 787]|uniref:DUF2628 domain-containing protein n=1 Tax=Agrobacterium sp. SORGH_AS 787 TaxID=3041775 RepID=UPI002782476D|nr:hypothetical protein [Rhizobium sp. SORGH_AS_0787]
MTSYLVLEAPGGPDRDHRTTRFIADRFSWLALFFPWLWFAIHRMWWMAASIVILQVAAGQVSRLDGFGITGLLFAAAVGLIAGFEGRNLLQRHLIAKGWTLKDVIVSHDRSTAEEIYFSNLPEDEHPLQGSVSKPEWKVREAAGGFMTNDPAGSFQFDLNGRR